MRPRIASLVLGLAGVGVLALFIGSLTGGDASADPKKKRKPAEVNIVQSVPLEFSSALSATVDVATMPPVAVSSLPTTTHLGQQPGSLVVLNLVNPLTTPIFIRAHDDGTTDTSEFVVPSGMKLIVTDVDWVVRSPVTESYAVLRLLVENRTTNARALVFLRTEPTYGGGGPPTFGTSAMVTGFVVGSGARVVADAESVANAAAAGSTVQAWTGNAMVVLRGYLVAAP
jgi:hypothetical protein